eukprot:9945922-Alexandrium_andersonii.AAC.1
MFVPPHAQIVYLVAILIYAMFMIRAQLLTTMHLAPTGLYRWAVYRVAIQMFVQRKAQVVHMVAT